MRIGLTGTSAFGGYASVSYAIVLQCGGIGPNFVSANKLYKVIVFWYRCLTEGQ